MKPTEPPKQQPAANGLVSSLSALNDGGMGTTMTGLMDALLLNVMYAYLGDSISAFCRSSASLILQYRSA